MPCASLKIFVGTADVFADEWSDGRADGGSGKLSLWWQAVVDA